MKENIQGKYFGFEIEGVRVITIDLSVIKREGARSLSVYWWLKMTRWKRTGRKAPDEGLTGSKRISLRWPTDIINPVYKSKFRRNTPHRRNTTVSLETYPLNKDLACVAEVPLRNVRAFSSFRPLAPLTPIIGTSIFWCRPNSCHQQVRNVSLVWDCLPSRPMKIDSWPTTSTRL